jgi:hypothetical protein
MGRPEHPLDPAAGQKAQFAAELRQLRGSVGGPSYREMARRAHYSSSTLAAAASGRALPTWDVTRAFVLACDGDEEHWRQRWRTAHDAMSGKPEPANRPPRTRRHWLLAIPILLVLGITVTASLVLAAPGARHSEFLGQPDLAAYCRDQGDAAASLDGTTAYDWHCLNRQGARESLSVIDACRWQYHSSTATARFADIGVPDSWECWDRLIVLGVVDLPGFCRSRGYVTLSLDGRTTDSWSCVSGSGTHVKIDPDAACRWQYGQRVLVVNLGIYDVTWERWECWG